MASHSLFFPKVIREFFCDQVLHLDLKPENILCLTKTGNRIKIIDFGLARFYDPNKKLQVRCIYVVNIIMR